ncbi:hypothetical protein [Hymenobacter negativus]|uniref:hypothetical protein n=1 Tax=Hymenobacter negativus TaxID=2795026 RepID=UPI001AB0051E|nr:hypothetical protein [Hymenobacter negativus]
MAEQEQKIKEIQDAQQLAPANAKSVLFQEVLRKLLANEIAQFKLTLDEYNTFYCNFRLVRRTLIMSIPEINRHRSDNRFRKKQLAHMERLGFRLYDHKDKLMLFLPYSKEEDLE